MARVESSLFTRLSAFAGLTALIGSGSSCRLYPDLAAQGATLPFVVMQTTNETQPNVMDGLPSIAETDISFECHASTAEGADAVADQIYTALMDQESATGVKGILFSARRRAPAYLPETFITEIDFTIHWA